MPKGKPSPATPKPGPAASSSLSVDPQTTGGEFPIVGIGMSAGGLEVATKFLEAMPAESGMGFVIVQHLEPTRKSLLAELLGKHTAMPVLEIADGMEVRPNHVYVIVPARTLRIEQGKLRLSDPTESRGHRHPIDDFFTSLAKDRATTAIAVVLSGAGSNASAGIQDIKLAGGMCIAQTPETAKFDSMPRYAIASGAVDFVLAPEDMPAVLIRYAQQPYVEGNAVEVIGSASKAGFSDVLTLIRARTSHDFRQYKRTTLTRRALRRMGLAGLESYDDYLARLRDDPAELQALVRDMMINVTGFFRDSEAWDALESEVIGPLVKGALPDQVMRVWVPACSTGEEAYTIAMLLADRPETTEKGLQIKIFATDLGDNNLAAARRGVYAGSMVESLSAERLERFFEKTGASYRIKRAVRETVVFAPQNLLSDPPYSKMDLVSCRNLLIYLDTQGQDRVFSLAHFALRDGGFLFLGNAESIGQRDHLFSLVSKRWRIFRRIGGKQPAMLNFPIWPAIPGPDQEREKPKLADVAMHALAVRFGPASVVIDRHYRIQHFHGMTQDYLTQPPGPPTLDLMAMARDGLGLAIRRSVKQAMADNEAAKSVATRGKAGRVEVTASPLGEDGEDRLILVSFSPVRKGAAEAAATAPEAAVDSPRDADDELKEARDELHAIVEEYETANEELKAANEEATSVNEELQATNEELESSKEEMQSLNEELNAVNAELEHKVSELDETGDDLRNLLAGNDIATIFLDTHTHIKWFSPAVTRLFDVLDTDIGRPIANFAQKFVECDLVGKARNAIDNLATVDEMVQAHNGRRYALRVQPYRTRDHRIGGAVASFVDITELVASQSATIAERDYAEAIVQTVHDPMIVLDADLRVQSANPAFYAYFLVKPQEVEGQHIYELGDGQWNLPELRMMLEEMLPAAGRIAEFEVEQNFPAIGRRSMSLNAQRIVGLGDRPDLILLAFDDTTERKLAEHHREVLLAELSHRVKNLLAVVQSIAAHTLRGSNSLADYDKAFTGRLLALARAHDIAFNNGLDRIALGWIVEQALEPFQANGRIAVTPGEEAYFNTTIAQSLTLMLHELATNAVKHGALSVDGGKVAIRWQVERVPGETRLVLDWRESGGPQVCPPNGADAKPGGPKSGGQGMRLIKGSIRHELGGEVKMDFHPAGLHAEISFPFENAVNNTRAVALIAAGPDGNR